MSTEVKPTDWDAEDNRWEPTPSGGGSGLPPYTSADKGKFLGLGEDAEHLVEPKWEAVGGGARPIVELTNANFLSEMTTKLMEVLTACTDSAAHIKSGYAMTGDEDLFNAIKAVYDNNCDVLISIPVAGETLSYVPLSAATGVISDETYYSAMLYIPIFFYATNNYAITTRVYVTHSTDSYTFEIDMVGQKMTAIS